MSVLCFIFDWCRFLSGARCGLVEWAETLALKSLNVAVVCIYLRHNEQLTAWEILLDVISQLVQYSTWVPSVPGLVQDAFDRHVRLSSRPSLSELENLFKAILCEFAKVSIFLDGLDEMKPEVQAQVGRIMGVAEAHVIFVSRRLTLVEAEVHEVRGKPLVFLDVVAEDGDLDLFIEDSIKQTPGFNRLLVKWKIRDELVKTVRAKAAGM